MGFTWMMYISLTEKSVSFINEGIQYQMPLLIGVVIFKFGILAGRKFKTSKRLFYVNLAGYTVFLVIVILLDYRVEFFVNTA